MTEDLHEREQKNELCNGNTSERTHSLSLETCSRNRRNCCTRQKKILLVVFIFILIGGGICVWVVEWKELKSTTQSNGNTSEPQNTPNGNYSKYQNKINMTTCIYHTPEGFLGHLKKDPFGEECKHGSSYVNNTCYGPKSTQGCEECEDRKLPSVCFCDPKTHCSNSYGGKPRDGEGKEPCGKCFTYFKISKFNKNGKCTCDNADLKCNCAEGFGGFMCSSILKRVCTLTDTKSSLKHTPECYESNEKECKIIGAHNKRYKCNVLREADIKQSTTLPSCQGTVTS